MILVLLAAEQKQIAMKTTIRLSIMALIAVAMTTGSVEGQNVERERHHRDHDEKVVVVKRERYPHHRRVIVYHPVWGPRLTYHHRWVYFPRYNFYWDNVRRVYVYRNNNVWVVNAAIPIFAVRVNLNAEQKVELPDRDDSVDNIQNQNSEHVSLYKVEQERRH